MSLTPIGAVQALAETKAVIFAGRDHRLKFEIRKCVGFIVSTALDVSLRRSLATSTSYAGDVGLYRRNRSHSMNSVHPSLR